MTHQSVKGATLVDNVVQSWVCEFYAALDEVDVEGLPWGVRTTDFFDGQRYKVLRKDASYVSGERTHCRARALGSRIDGIGRVC